MLRNTWAVTLVACGALMVSAPAFAADTTAVSTTTTTLTPSIGTPTSLVNTTQPTVLGTQISNDPLAHTGRATGGELVLALALAGCGGGLLLVSRRAWRLERPSAR